jgi:hypothetical protein
LRSSRPGGAGAFVDHPGPQAPRRSEYPGKAGALLEYHDTLLTARERAAGTPIVQSPRMKIPDAVGGA